MLRLKLDLHIHSEYSTDAFNTIDLINNKIKGIGYDGYALADHDTIEGLKEANEKKGELIFLPALEVSARGAHIIALNPTDIIKPGLSLSETVEVIHEQGATAILAHPYSLPRSWVSINQVREASFDAIEVANSTQIPYNYICALNQKLADRLGLPATGGSDSHIPETIGRSYTIIESESTEPDDIIEAIRLGRTTVGGSYMRITEWYSKIIKKKII
jgi:predicted metal-dependent phosphoesterase TrpH